MNKQDILDQIIGVLQKEETTLIKAGLDAKEAATESEAKPENQYDTRALEQSYLAAGQSKRAEALKAAIIQFKTLPLHVFDSRAPIDISALITIEGEDGDQKIYFLLPSQGGIKIQFKEKEISTLSPESPLGQKLIGKTSGDTIEIPSASQMRSFQIIAVE